MHTYDVTLHLVLVGNRQSQLLRYLKNNTRARSLCAKLIFTHVCTRMHGHE